MILICRDLCSNVLGYLPLQVMPHRVEKRAMVFFVLFLFFDHFTPFFFRSKRQNDIFYKKNSFLIEKKGSNNDMFAIF